MIKVGEKVVNIRQEDNGSVTIEIHANNSENIRALESVYKRIRDLNHSEIVIANFDEIKHTLTLYFSPRIHRVEGSPPDNPDNRLGRRGN